MKISTTIKAAVAAVALTSVAAPASAGVVTFQTSGQWANWVGGSSVTTSSSGGDATIKWGNTTKWDKSQSSYLFDAQSVSPVNLQDGETSNAFTLAEFKHYNDDISGSGITSVDLIFTTQIFVDGQFAADRTFGWTFSHEETANSGFWTCAYGGTGLFNCNDRVAVDYNGDLVESFQFGDDLYTLTLAGLQVKNGPNWMTKDVFVTEENKFSTAKIRGQLSMTTLTSAVPEPATWAMMIVGFFGAGTMIRTTRRQAAFAAA